MITLSSGDDAIHANNQVIVDDGEITVSKSCEGIEGLCIDINGQRTGGGKPKGMTPPADGTFRESEANDRMQVPKGEII